ncbi:MAG: acyltransferase family protein [Odoribacter sp.]|nr:acyltransferase family protein [Odoribacter sp.]
MENAAILTDRQTNRLTYIDVFRAFGIILMIMGHIGFGGYFDYFIHAFHMPMFFLISGRFFPSDCKAIKASEFLKKKAKTLLLPYIIFGLFHYAVWLVMNYPDISLKPLKSLLFINTDNLPIAGALWFLTALFFSEIFYFVIVRFINNVIVRNLVIGGVALFGCVSGFIIPFQLPWSLGAAFVGVGLLHIGFLWKRYTENAIVLRITSMRVFEWVILGIAATALIALNGYINMRTGSYAIIPLFWINVILAVIVGINLSKAIVQALPDRIVEFLCSVGKNSIIYVCFNQLVISPGKRFLEAVSIPSAVDKLILLAFTMIILYLLALCFTNSKLKIYIGRF